MTAVSNPIPYHELKPTQISHKLPNIPLQHMQRALLVGAIACAIISLIPSLGWVGAISLRSVSCTMVGIQILHSLKKSEGKGCILLQIVRLASVALGLVGVAMHLNILVITSIALDILFQAAEAGRGTHQKDLYKSLSHASFILVDSFAMIGMLTGGWQFIVVAAALNSAVMFAFAAKTIVMGVINRDATAAFDAACYIALGGIGIASAVRTAELYTMSYKHHYQVTNSGEKTLVLTNCNGKVIKQIAPGETVEFTGPSHLHVKGEYNTINPHWTEGTKHVIQKPMTAAEFPTLPIGSSAVVTEEPRLKVEEVDRNIESEALNAFLAPVEGEPTPCLARDDDRPQIALIHQGTSATYVFDLELACATSDFLNGWNHMNENREVTLDLDKDTFDRLMRYFTHGTLNNLDRLREWELIKLYNAADFLQVNRLRLLCQREIAIRLCAMRWQNTSLFEPYIRETRSLSPLINLFDFTPQPLL